MNMSDSLFFRHHAAGPYFNMAFDECMYIYALNHPGSVLVRFYTWRPGAITFGLNQRRDTALDFTRLGDTPAIRRITGGRAVYHDVSELTYAVAINPHLPERQVLGGSPSDIYRRLSRALMSFLEHLGVRSELIEKSSPQNARPEFFHKAPCFASSARYEIAAAGHKIVASAQRQLRGVILQHGSIKVSGVVAHPALDATALTSDVTSQAVDKEGFELTARLFARVMGAQLGVDLEYAGSLPSMEAALRDRVCEVTKKALARRDIIKQIAKPNSL
jgi:lipoate-protein ligase A